MSDIPTSIARSELTIFGVTLVCHVLDNGQRVFEPEGIAQLFSGEAVGTFNDEDAAELALFIRGETP